MKQMFIVHKENGNYEFLDWKIGNLNLKFR